MIAFDPNTLYSVDELRHALQGTVELPTFLDRLGLRDRRVFKGAVWDWEIIEAARKADPFSETGKAETAAAVVVDLMIRPRRGKAGKAAAPAGRLSAKDLRD